jgi:hypothetical protein
MHNDCGRNRIKNGDDWLKAELPPVIEWADRNAAVIFITWDEGWKTSRLPFFAIGRGVKEGYVSDKSYTHSSISELWSRSSRCRRSRRFRTAASYPTSSRPAPIHDADGLRQLVMTIRVLPRPCSRTSW